MLIRISKFAISLGFLTFGLVCSAECVLYGDESLSKLKDIYYDSSGLGQPWKQCYTVDTQNALQAIKDGQFAGASDLLLETTKKVGKVISVKYRYLDGYAKFKPCSFKKADDCSLNCKITFTDFEIGSELSKLPVENQISCEQKFPESKGKYIDCKNKLAHPVVNTWGQRLIRREFRAMQEMNAQKIALRPSAIGSVKAGGSLDLCMNWSASLALSFIESSSYPELCDWSIFQMYPEFNQTWCPWGIEITKIQCDGEPLLVSQAARMNFPLDVSNSEVKLYCKDQKF